MKRIIFLALVVLSTMLIFNSCKKKADNSTQGANDIWLQNTAFNPSQKTIPKGTTITFTNKDNMTHTVSEMTNMFMSSGDMKMNNTFVYTFSTAGVYHIYCKYHSVMTATITVQ
jgi:plastocyanin